MALEEVPIGVCDTCRASYYHAAIMKQAEALVGKRRARTMKVPVSRFVEAG